LLIVPKKYIVEDEVIISRGYQISRQKLVIYKIDEYLHFNTIK